MHDGSITFSTALDNAQLEKELNGLVKKIEKKEREIADLTSKRDAAKEKSLFDVKELDAEKAKLQELREQLKEIRAFSNDKANAPAAREEAKAQIPDLQGELRDQQERVRLLQTEWNKLENSIDSYNRKIAAAAETLDRQKEEAGELTRQIGEMNAAWGSGQFNQAAARVRTLQTELREMERQGLWFGDPGYDKAYGQLMHISEVTKDHKREILQAYAYAEEMADSMGVADQRVVDLGKELSGLQQRMRELKRAGVGLGSQEYDYVAAKIADISLELTRYKNNLRTGSDGSYFAELAEGLEVSDERILRLNGELEQLKNRKKDLEHIGAGLGTEQYDQVVARMAEINRELKEYQKALTELPKESAPETLPEDLGLTEIPEEGAFDQLIEDADIASQHIVDLGRELKALKIRQKELSGQGLGLGYAEYDQAESRMGQITRELRDYQKALGENGETSGLDAKLKAAEKMGSILSKLSKSLGGSGSIGAEAASTAQSLSAAAGGMGELSAAAAGAGPVVLGVVAALTVLKAAADKIAENAKKLTQSFLTFLQKGGELLKSFSKAAVKAFRQTALSAVKLLDKVNVFPKMFSSIGKSLVKLGQMIRRVFVFSVITSGLRMVREQMGAYLGVDAQFAASLRQLKGVLLTAFQPIYDVAVPALTVLMNLLSRAIAAVTQFTAVLFGTTAKQAQKNAQALYQQSKATQAAGDAAEEAANQLASFDEINKLQDESKAGGGGVDIDTGPAFDWEYEDTPFPDWGEAFDAFLDKLLDGIPQLKAAFLDFADWLNDLAKKLYDMFTFPGVLDKVKQIGRGLADALNSLVNAIDWNLLGHALGAGLNLALNFLTSFLYGFDWMNLGRKLAQFVNGLAAEIDWYEFGRLLWSGFKIGLETLAGFILGLDMPLMAEAASRTVIGFFDEMKNTIERIPWDEIGRQIAAFLTNLRWYEMLSSVTSAIAAGLAAAISALEGFLEVIVPELDRIAGEIVLALLEFFRDKVQWGDLATAIGNGITAALQFVARLLDPELLYEIGKAIGDFLINLQWVEIFGGLARVLAAAINGAVAAVRGFLDSVTPNLKEIAGGIAEKINQFVQEVDWEELGRTIHDGISAALDFLLEILDQLDWESIGQAVVDFFTELNWGELMSKWGSVVGKAIGGALKDIDLSDMLSVGGDIAGGILSGILNKLNESGGFEGFVKRSIFNPFINAFKSLFGIASPSTVMMEQGVYIVEGLLKGISDTWNFIVEFFGTALDNLLAQLGEGWENIKQNAIEKWKEIKESIGQKLDELRETAQKKFDELKQKISEAWTRIKDEASQKWNEIKTALSQTWDNIKTNAQEKFTNIKQSIIDKMGELKNHDWKSIGSSIMDGIWNGLKSVWSNVTTWAGRAADALGNIFKGAKTAVSNIVNTVTGGSRQAAAYSMPDVTTYQLPALAQGAVIPPNREFMAVLGDQDHGNNLEGPESLFRKIVREESGMGNTALLEAILEAIRAGQVIMVDRQVLGRTVTREQNRQTRANGRSVVLG